MMMMHVSHLQQQISRIWKIENSINFSPGHRPPCRGAVQWGQWRTIRGFPRVAGVAIACRDDHPRLARRRRGAPQPAELKTFHDWTVGCDNGRACHAVALMPGDWPEDAVTMSVRRGPEAGGAAGHRLRIGETARRWSRWPPTARRLAVRLIGADERAPGSRPADVATVDRRPAIGQRAAVAATRTVQSLGTISLAGASAALLYMDDQQRRIGTVTALVRPGRAGCVGRRPPPAAVRVVAAPPVSGRGRSR